MARPTVSIVIPTYNRADVLSRALDSVIAQTVHSWEIVLIDDGSTDATAELAERYERRLGDRFQYRYQKNAGASAARNTGIDLSRGEFVAFLDSDDEFLPNKLERQLKLFELRPSLGMVYSDYSYVDLQGQRVASVFDTLTPQARQVPHERVTPTMCVCLRSLFDSLLRKYFVSTITGMVRRSVLNEICWPVGIKYAEEWLFYLQVSRACNAGFVDEPLCLHHHTAGSMSRTDKGQNVQERYRTVCAMRDMFTNVSSGQRRVMREHCSDSLIQIAYDQAKDARWGDACKLLFRSLRREPNRRVAIMLCRLFGSGLLEACWPFRKSLTRHHDENRQVISRNTSTLEHASVPGTEGVSLW